MMAKGTYAVILMATKDLDGTFERLQASDAEVVRQFWNDVNSGGNEAVERLVARDYVDRFPATLGKQIDGLITVGGMTSDNSWLPGSCACGVEILAPSEGIFSASIPGWSFPAEPETGAIPAASASRLPANFAGPY